MEWKRTTPSIAVLIVLTNPGRRMSEIVTRAMDAQRPKRWLASHQPNRFRRVIHRPGQWVGSSRSGSDCAGLVRYRTRVVRSTQHCTTGTIFAHTLSYGRSVANRNNGRLTRKYEGRYDSRKAKPISSHADQLARACRRRSELRG